ncbi:MAG: extracellular solute-binding protein [Actinobacteria bacterium]|nr:extracellular solute-binding protein [Actinomycetota bacterium]
MEPKRRALLAAVAAGALLFTACAATPGATTSGGATQAGAGEFAGTPSGTLKAWGFENADDVGQSRLDYVAKQLSGVTVSLDATAFDSQKFITRQASGDMPDVVQMDRALVATYAAQGLITPLGECFAAQNVDPAATYYKNVVADVTYKGDIYAVPQFFQPPAIIVNNRVAKAAGVAPEDIDTSNLDTLLAAISKMYKEKNGKPTTLGFDPQAHSNTQLWMLALGGKLTDDQGAPTLTDPANAAAFEWLKKVYDAQGGFAKVKSFSDTFDFFGDKNQYVADQVGAQMNFQWYPNVLASTMKKIDIWTVPIKDASGNTFAAASGSAFVIPAGAKNKAAACAWAVGLTSSESWMAAAEARAATRAKDGAPNTGLMTGRPDMDQKIKTEYVKSVGNEGFDQTVSAFYDVLPSGASFGASPAGESIKAELSNALISFLSGDKDANTALADAQTAAESAYQSVVG